VNYLVNSGLYGQKKSLFKKAILQRVWPSEDAQRCSLRDFFIDEKNFFVLGHRRTRCHVLLAVFLTERFFVEKEARGVVLVANGYL